MLHDVHPKMDWDKEVCSDCRKPRFWKLFDCRKCEKIFIKNFKHPAFDLLIPWCWECLEAFAPDEICQKYPPVTVRIHESEGKKAPPRKPTVDFNLLAEFDFPEWR